MEHIVLARTPDIIATEINSIKEQTRIMVLSNSIEIGRKLVEAKELLPHGDWSKWLESSVSYSQRTANNLMKVFKEYGNNQVNLFGELNSQTFANLSYSQAVALLGIGDMEEREEFVKGNNVEGMSTRELEKAIKEKKAAEKEKEDALKKLRTLEKEKAELESSFSNKEQSLKASQDTIAMLKESLDIEKENSKQEINKIKVKLDNAKCEGNNDLVEKLKKELESKENNLNDRDIRIKELEKELSEKPVDVDTAVVEKVPEEIEKELEELRGKIKENECTSKYKASFSMLVKTFNDLLAGLSEIEEESVREKYTLATKNLINKMGERL